MLAPTFFVQKFGLSQVQMSGYVSAAQIAHIPAGFVVTALAGFGGSILVPVLLGCHDNVGPFVLANDGAAWFFLVYIFFVAFFVMEPVEFLQSPCSD